MTKKRKYYLGIALVVVVVLLIIKFKSSNKEPAFETTAVKKGDLLQSVEATGNIESANEISLHFEVVGTVGTISVTEGATVTKGQFLASLKLDALNAAVAKARADLNKQEAGATAEDKAYYKAALDSAKANLAQATADGDTDIAKAQRDVEEAQNDLKLAEGGDNSQIVNQAYEDAVSTLQATLSKLDDGLTQADNILGIDNELANDSFETSLAVLDDTKLTEAEILYTQARNENNATSNQVLPLNSGSNHGAVDSALTTTDSALLKMNELLKKVSEVLNATVPNDDLSQTSLDAKKTTMETTRSSVLTKYTAVVNEKQAIVDSKNSLTTFTFAYNQAVDDLKKAKQEASTNVSLKQASYDQALANYNGKINPPRDVDLAPYRASLLQAIANRSKAVLNSPIAGIVTKVHKKVGEAVSTADSVIELLAPQYQITVDIPEVDVAKLSASDTVKVTLDAFGNDREFLGSVAAIEPASTLVQDVVYYRVTVGLSGSLADVRSGMTANVAVKTNESLDTLFIPRRLVRTRDDGTKYVRVLKGGAPQEVDVTLGLKGDGAMVEILSGLSEGDEVIVRENE